MLNRKIPPSFVDNISFCFPDFHRQHLSNGIECCFLPQPKCSVVQLDIVFKAGKWYEESPGISYFSTHMLDQGSQSKSAAQIADFFDLYGGHIECGSGRDFASLSLHALAKHWESLFPFFFEMFSTPVFPDVELTHLKETYTQQLRIEDKKTDRMASKLIGQELYGTTHPYGWVVQEDHIKDINSNCLNVFFEEHHHVSHVFIAGDISDKMKHYIISYFSTLSSNPDAKRKTNQETPPVVSQRYIEKPHSLQTSLRLGKQTISRSHPDYFSLLLLTYHLGGYFGSRLMKNLREKRGFTYGISSSVNAFKHSALLLIGTDVNKEHKNQAMKEIKHEIVELTQHDIPNQELMLAKRHFIGTFQISIASLSSIMEKIKMLSLYELPEDYYQQLIRHIDTVSSDELLIVAQNHFAHDTFFELSVG